MAAYNAEKYIDAAIMSVIKQSYGLWELIIVNDGSSDNTPAIIDKYCAVDERILGIHQKNSGSAASARATALEYVTGDYIQILDSDDVLDESILFKYYYKIKEVNPDIIVPNCKYFFDKYVYWEKKGFKGNYLIELNGVKSFYYSLDWTIHGLFCVKTELVKRVGYYQKLVNGDEFTTRKLLYESAKTAFVDGYYYYRKNSNSTTQSNNNIARMFECLVTNHYIYMYTQEKKMPQLCVNKAFTLLCWSLFSYQQKFERYKEKFGPKEKNWTEGIIRNVYFKTIKDINLKMMNIYSFFLLCSLGNFKLFCLENALIFKIRKGF